MRKLLILIIFGILAVQVTQIFVLSVKPEKVEVVPTIKVDNTAKIVFDRPDHGKYSIEEILMDPCLSDEDCKTPAQYLMQSRCAFTSYCLENRCAVVCPKPNIQEGK